MNSNMTHASELVMWGLVAHLVADWLLQNDWMASNKCNLVHPAAWVHGAIHAAVMALVFPWPWAMLIGLAHMVIDTRVPLNWWGVIFGKVNDSTVQAWMVSVWNDQALHVLLIAVVAVVVA